MCGVFTNTVFQCWGGSPEALGSPMGATFTGTPVATPLSVRMTAPNSSFRLSPTVPVSWSSTDASGINHFDVRRRGVAWNGRQAPWALWLAPTKATSGNYSGTYGHTYCFDAHAQETGGQLSDRSGAACTAVPLSSDQLSYSAHWARHADGRMFGGFAHETKTFGAKMSRTGLVVEKLSLVATMCAVCGKVEIRWNGALIKTQSLFNSTTLHKQVLPITSFTTPHTGTLTVTDTSPSGKTILIEGVADYNAA